MSPDEAHHARNDVKILTVPAPERRANDGEGPTTHPGTRSHTPLCARPQLSLKLQFSLLLCWHNLAAAGGYVKESGAHNPAVTMGFG
jgi:hypothetical protein